jgi:hypothetical protein
MVPWRIGLFSAEDGVCTSARIVPRSTTAVGVAETVKITGTTTWVAGGQFQMPFSYEIQKLNCTP